MSKRVIGIFLYFIIGVALFAGDVAQFVDLGFSPDGQYYMFGQYGVDDVNWQAYAEIYTIDVKKNEFIPNGVFVTAPSVASAGKSGKEVFDVLLKKADSVIKKYNISTENMENPLYIMAEDTHKQLIKFREFESTAKGEAVWWEVRMNVLSNEKKQTSSFYLIVDKNNENTVSKRYVVGSPSVERKNVNIYTIRKIIPSKNHLYLVFIIEKEIKGTKGNSIRFMAETLVL